MFGANNVLENRGRNAEVVGQTGKELEEDLIRLPSTVDELRFWSCLFFTSEKKVEKIYELLENISEIINENYINKFENIVENVFKEFKRDSDIYVESNSKSVEFEKVKKIVYIKNIENPKDGDPYLRFHKIKFKIQSKHYEGDVELRIRINNCFNYEDKLNKIWCCLTFKDIVVNRNCIDWINELLKSLLDGIFELYSQLLKKELKIKIHKYEDYTIDVIGIKFKNQEFSKLLELEYIYENIKSVDNVFKHRELYDRIKKTIDTLDEYIKSKIHKDFEVHSWSVLEDFERPNFVMRYTRVKGDWDKAETIFYCFCCDCNTEELTREVILTFNNYI